jgi:DNA-binding CsgD family transcriptional regulator
MRDFSHHSNTERGITFLVPFDPPPELFFGGNVPLGKPLLDILDGIGYGALLLDASGEILRLNLTAARLLSQHQHQSCQTNDLACSQRALAALLNSGGINRSRLDDDNWTPIQRTNADGAYPLILRTIPIQTLGNSGPHKVMVLINLDVTPRPSADVLKRVFGLTSTEARLAIELTGGRSPEEIAVTTRVTVGTVRKQLATVFSKTNTHRQSELVALLSRLAILP